MRTREGRKRKAGTLLWSFGNHGIVRGHMDFQGGFSRGLFDRRDQGGKTGARHHFLDRVPLPSRSSLQQRGRRPKSTTSIPQRLSSSTDTGEVSPVVSPGVNSLGRWLSPHSSARLGSLPPNRRTRTAFALQDLHRKDETPERRETETEGGRKWVPQTSSRPFRPFSPHSTWMHQG